MKKIQPKKLIINKEIISKLQESQMLVIKGGSGYSCMFITCTRNCTGLTKSCN